MNSTQNVEIHQRVPRDPRQAIEWFDSWYDVRLEHDQCLNLLRDQGVFALSAPDPYQALTYYVGGCWCEMIKWDVLYEVRRGALVREESRILAELLDKWTSQQPIANQATATPAVLFGTNVLARWMDGAGKLYYRNREYTDARIMFERALRWAKQGGHWFLLPDLSSNFVRAEFEEQRTAGKKPDLVEKYSELLRQTIDQAGTHKLEIPRQVGDTAPYRCAPDDGALREKREFLRGLCSILHNMSLAEELQGNTESSFEHSHESEVIAQVSGDEYRLAQAINHQALLMAKKAREQAPVDSRRASLDEARQLFGRVKDELHWRRGRLIAWQQSAALLADTSDDLRDVFLGVDELERLLKEIKSNRRFGSGEQSADLEVYDYTVRAMRRIADNRKAGQSDEGRLAYENLLKRVENEELTVARAVRHVVKISQYKQNFNRERSHVFERQIAKHVASGEFLRALALLEEASGRELLDVLALEAIPGVESEQASFDWKSPDDVFDLPETKVPEGSAGSGWWGAEVSRTPESQRRFGMRRLVEGDANIRTEYLKKAMQEYEYEALKNPIPVTPYDPDVAQKVVELSKRTPGFAMVRYASLPNRDSQSRTLGAFVVRDGELTYHKLDWFCAENTLRQLIKADPNHPEFARIVPEKEQARSLWDALLAPLWPTVAPTPSDIPKHLVLVPHVDLFQAPLHLAMENDDALPLAARVPLAFSVSATMHLASRRYARRWLRPTTDDDLCAIVSISDPAVTGEEICETGWDSEHLHVFGNEPVRLYGHHYLGPAQWQRIEAALPVIMPKFLVVSCHGSYDSRDDRGELGPTLHLGPEIPYASQFDIARRLKLPGNMFTALAACVSGQGTGLAGGDVAGFVRSFIAAGVGALGVTLFSVRDYEIVATVRHLLRATRWAAGRGALDVVASMQRYYAERCSRSKDANQRLDACPLVIYL